MKISIGILAYNEADHISATLHSIFQQSIFSGSSMVQQIEIIVVPNGCQDKTAQVATDTLSQLGLDTSHPKLSWSVHELDIAGKSNAWNIYIHKLSSLDAQYCILMDADIVLLNPQTLIQLIKTLENAPEAWVSIDKPVKDIMLKAHKNWFESLSVAVSTLQKSANRATGLCGQLYCGSAEKLRRIWMPVGLPVEDGFLRRMVLTSCFQSSENDNHILLASSASHSFQAYTSLPSLFRHEIRIVLGSTINSFLYDYLRQQSQGKIDAGTLIKQKNQDEPLWLHHLIQITIQQKGWWLIPPWFLLHRFQKLQQNHRVVALLKLPIACTAFFVDLLICFLVNQKLHKQIGLGYW